MTETKKRKKPSSILMLAMLPDLRVRTRMATTKTSSMDHLPMWETNRYICRVCSASSRGQSQSTSMVLIFTKGKATVNTKRMRNKKISSECQRIMSPLITETWLSKTHSLVTEVNGRKMAMTNSTREARYMVTTNAPRRGYFLKSDDLPGLVSTMVQS